MGKPTITIVKNKLPITKMAKADMSLPETEKKEGDNTTTENKFDLPPTTKEELLALYHCEPLPVNNLVNSAEIAKVNKQRVALYNRQQARAKFFYTVKPSIRPTYLMQELKAQLIEYKSFQIVRSLDQRGILDLAKTETMWQQLHVVDDLIIDIVRRMPAQQPIGWQFTSGNKNHLKFPTVGRLRDTSSVADQSSLNSYILGHFGVMSYTYDRAYFIGHVLGYLFSCYYLAHLSLSYSVTPLPKSAVADYEYATLDTAKMVRLLQGLDVHCKRRIYQLAIFSARLSMYRLDKQVEKMLIAEVNEFDKKQQISHLDALLTGGLMPDMPTHSNYD